MSGERIASGFRAVSSNRRLVVLAGVFLPVCFAAMNLERTPDIDDAYISYRYARNLVEGHGLVYNRGERVEGITNLLWTLGVAAGVRLGFEAPYVSHALSLLSSTALLGVTFGLAFSVIRGWPALLPPVLLVCSSPFAVWAFSGLETPLWAALIVGALWAAVHDRMFLAALLAGLCFWTRPDGGLIGIAVLAPWLWRRWRVPGAWGPAVLWVAMLGALTLWRLWYYGSPVPNTFHAKVGGVPFTWGLRYCWTFACAGAWLLLPVALPSLRLRALRASWLFMLLQTGYILAVCGDVFQHGRFFLPVLALLAVGAAVTASGRAGPLFAPVLRRYGGAALVAGWLVVTAYMPVMRAEVLEAEHRRRVFGQSEGARFADFSHGKSVAGLAIGALGYHAPDARVIDMLGLVSPEVAASKGSSGIPWPGHQCSNPEWVLAQRPDVVLAEEDIPLSASIDILKCPDFRERYERAAPGIWVRKHETVAASPE